MVKKRRSKHMLHMTEHVAQDVEVDEPLFKRCIRLHLAETVARIDQGSLTGRAVYQSRCRFLGKDIVMVTNAALTKTSVAYDYEVD